jgi:hypothetical protein
MREMAVGCEKIGAIDVGLVALACHSNDLSLAIDEPRQKRSARTRRFFVWDFCAMPGSASRSGAGAADVSPVGSAVAGTCLDTNCR